MPNTLTANPDVYGYIENGVGATDQTGLIACAKCSGASTVHRYRAYASYNTSSIPDKAKIVSADLTYYFATVTEDVTCVVNNYGMRIYYEHDQIGASLVLGDWGFSNFAVEEDYGGSAPSTGSHQVALPIATVNVDGDTDLEFRGWSTWSTCSDGPIFCIRNKWFGGQYPTHLDIEYHMQGVVNKISNRNIALVGATLQTLTKLLCALGIIGEGHRVVRADEDGIVVRARFGQRTVMAGC